MEHMSMSQSKWIALKLLWKPKFFAG